MCNNQKGQSIVEISLITPLLLVALYVPFDFGIGLFTAHLMQNAVREGARIASTKNPFDIDAAGDVADDVLDNRLPNVFSSKNVTVAYHSSGASNCLRFVEVTSNGTYNFFLYRLVELIGFTAPDSIQITRTTRMRYEFQPDINGGNSATTTYCTLTFAETRP